jgi:20S proteasome alpha/beta subunit
MRTMCRFDPLWNSVVIGGFQDGKPFLGSVGMLGVHFTDQHIATGGRGYDCTEAARDI